LNFQLSESFVDQTSFSLTHFANSSLFVTLKLPSETTCRWVYLFQKSDNRLVAFTMMTMRSGRHNLVLRPISEGSLQTRYRKHARY